MAAGDRELLIKITGVNKDAIRKLDRTAGKVNAVGRRIGRVAGNVVRLTGQIAAGVGALATGAFFAGRKILQVGGRVEETANRFQTVFGPAVEEASAFLDDFARKAGLTDQEAQDLMASAGGLAQGFGFTKKESEDLSQSVLKLAGDLSSFHNVPVQQSVEAITSALAGEREQLKQLDIVLRQSMVNQRALANTGKESAEALTEQEKAAASLQLITEKAGVAVGDLDRTLDSAANRGRRLARDFRQLRDEIATSLMPAVEEGMRFLEENRETLISFIRNSLQSATRMIIGFVRFAVKAHRTISNTFLGQLFGMEGEAAELAQADQRREELKEMRRLIEGDAPAVVGQGLQNFLQGTGIQAESKAEALRKIESEIDRLTKKIDGEGGLTDAFSTWQREGEELLSFLDEFEAEVVGGLGTIGGGGGDAGGGGGGGGGEGDQEPISAGDRISPVSLVTAMEPVKREQGQATDLIKSPLEGAIADVSDFAASRAESIGQSLITGIITGSGNMGETLKNFMISLASKFIMSALMGGLGIASPSRRAREEIGRPLVWGIMRGVRQELPALAATMDEATRVAMGVRPPAIGTPSVGNVQTRAGTLSGASIGLNIDPSKLPDPVTPREAARDRQWLQLMVETEKELELVRGER